MGVLQTWLTTHSSARVLVSHYQSFALNQPFPLSPLNQTTVSKAIHGSSRYLDEYSSLPWKRDADQ